MDKLADVSADALRTALGDVESAKAAKRLMVALDYKDDVSVDVLTERYGIPRSTLYYWLDRFEERSIADAIEDEPRPGRPPRLTEAARETLRSDLADDPAAHGYDADEWTPELVQTHVEREYGVSYSTGHVRRLLREFELAA
ncbi:Transposase [Halogranum gelatinilyticum]|uniref:Transposase n=1 Tax=Halogranum gelatinilyticum TaxID=660521 RepID=A0A1G9ZC92_9EURY|nr:helix-turn-helix domain-containing protein [Halogranum gelatinilyticum]SDN18884.1 Transposase [Halogranum gelatinilyticum]